MSITDVDWSLTKDVFSIVGTVFAALGVIAASSVAVIGLATWKRQIRGANDHELSRRMLIEMYKFKKAFYQARSPAIYSHEVREEGDPVFTTSPTDRFKRQQLGFKRRIENFNREYTALSVSMFEAEALWGRDVVRCFRRIELLKDEYEDYAGLRLLTIDPDEPADERQDHLEFFNARRTVLRSRLGAEDAFGDEVESSFLTLEKLLKTKLVG
ncbi:hypothetical protein [Pseudomonas lini]|uniref:hypothetical protein n=1 Tax=Pseudomonas lini TaxID=163011 RepID=UPI0012E0CC58|nr:hypothetical protein [Pseudomonas lini]